MIIAGGGLGGLATALFSARRGHDVVVVDRDPGPSGWTVDDLAAWDRAGVAQAAFSHYFLARSTRVVREEAPDLLDQLAMVGITPSSVRFGEGFEDDRALTARRPVYEAMMRGFVAREPLVDLRLGSVRGVVTDPRDPQRIAGVRLDDGTELRGDLIVDAGGRRTASARWLRAAGLGGPAVEEESCDRHYYCRHYRLRDGADYPADLVPMVQVLPYAVALVFIGDNRTFSVAFELSAEDPLKARMQDPDVFDRVLAELPDIAPWMQRSDPTSDLHVMAGLSNRRRRLVVDGRPVATGMALVGDACQYTNPALGQGVSLTFWMAQQLARSVERAAADPGATAVAYEAWVDDELGPRFERQLRADREDTRQLLAGLRGEGFIPPIEQATREARAVMVLAQDDEDVRHVGLRVGHLLERPSIYREDPAIAVRVASIVDRGLPQMNGDGPLPRKQFEALVGA